MRIAYDQIRHKICVMQRRDGGDDAHLDASRRATHRNKHAWSRNNKIRVASARRRGENKCIRHGFWRADKIGAQSRIHNENEETRR